MISVSYHAPITVNAVVTGVRLSATAVDAIQLLFSAAAFSQAQ